jgi:uncharacterized protein RhaS with RHS repeats
MGARYYEPKSGRFLSPDPLGHSSSLSLYDYCNSDPVNGLDPDGRCMEKGREARLLSEAEYQNAMHVVDVGATSSPDLSTTIRTIEGLGFSYLDDDLNDPETFQQQPISRSGVYTLNGMNTDSRGAQDIQGQVALSQGLDFDDVTSIENNRRSLFKDTIRVLGEQLLAIDVRAIRTAELLNRSNGGKIVAYSNGSALLGNARPYMSENAAANIDYLGLNPEWYIDAAHYGFKSAKNYKNRQDAIPILSPGNWWKRWDRAIDIDSSFFNFSKNHSFKINYSQLSDTAP